MKTKLISALVAIVVAMGASSSVALADAGYTKANYKIERVDKSKKNTSGRVYYENWYDKVVLTDSNEIAQKINEQIEEAVDSFFEEIDADAISPSTNMDFYYTMTSEVTQSDNGILSIRLTGKYFVGQHYGSDSTSEDAMSFNLRTGEKLKLTDVLSMSEAEADAYVKDCTLAEINKNPQPFVPEAKNFLADSITDQYSFYVKDDNIWFCWGGNYLTWVSEPSLTVKCPIVKIKVRLNGEYLVFDQPPLIINDRTMVPIRTIFEAMGYNVQWDQEKQTAYADLGTRSIEMTVGSKDMYVSGTKHTYDVAPINLSGRILVPARAVAELSGHFVEWDQESLTADIYDWYYQNENK